MRVLIDECAPSVLRRTLAKSGHSCRTVQEMGWSGKKNGELLALAHNEFDVLITVDTNLSLSAKSYWTQNSHRASPGAVESPCGP
jgi:predicted nuclease of predicted toxin-antitoxin system